MPKSLFRHLGNLAIHQNLLKEMNHHYYKTVTMRISIISFVILLQQTLPSAVAFTLQQSKAKSPTVAQFAPSFYPTQNTARGPLFGSNPTYADIHHINNRHSASDFLYNVLSLPQSVILREIRFPVLAVAGWSMVVSLVHRCLAMSGPASQAMAMKMSIPGTAHSLLVSALGLLLVFRTNSAYQRFNVSHRGDFQTRFTHESRLIPF
jgi:hypothetical protein